MAKWRLPELLSSLSARVPSSEAAAGKDEPEVAAAEESSRFAERPVDRSVLWLPGGWGEHDSSRPYPYELFVEQDLLRAVAAHAQEEVDGSYGLLTGRLLTCRRTRIPFVHVEAAHRSENPLPTDEDVASFREFFWSVREKAGRRGRVLVGWYHTHSLLGLQLSERDRQLHVTHFHDDWCCALVVVTRHGRAEGGFFQRDRGDILFRRSTRPFHEVVNQKVRAGGGPYVTTVSWENYWTHEPVLFARKPGEPESRGGRWYWRRRDPSSRTTTHLPGLGSGTIASEKLDGLRDQPAPPDEATSRKPEKPSYQPALGRPRRAEDDAALPEQARHQGPPSADAWAQWEQGREVRRARTEKRLKPDRQQAAADATQTEADADRRARARLAARAAAEAAARAAAEALGIESETDAVTAEAVSRAEREAAALASRRRPPPEVEPAHEVSEAVEADVAGTAVSATEVDTTRAAEVAAEVEVAEVEVAEVEVADGSEVADESEAPTEVEAVPEAEGVPESQIAAAESPPGETVRRPSGDQETRAAQLELKEPTEPTEVARVPAEPDGVAEAEVAEVESRAEPAPAGKLAIPGRKADVEAADKRSPSEADFVMPPMIIPDPPSRVSSRKYALLIGIAVPIAALLWWLLV